MFNALSSICLFFIISQLPQDIKTNTGVEIIQKIIVLIFNIPEIRYFIISFNKSPSY